MVNKDCFFTKSTLLLINCWDGFQIAMRRGLMSCRLQSELSGGDNRMNRRMCGVFLALIAMSPAIKAGAADNGKVPTTMDEVVVTATRSRESVREVPATVTVINSAELMSSGASSVVEALEMRANIHVRTYSGNPSQAQLDLRGFGGDNPFGKTLVMLDGRRLNRMDMASINWMQIPLQSIERIEVVRGANSVLYGDAAIAGVIHIITKKGQDGMERFLALEVGEDDYNAERAGLVGSSGRLSYSATLENIGTDGWRQRTGFTSRGGGLSLGYDINDTLSVTLTGSLNDTEYEMPGSLTKAEMKIDREQLQPARTWTTAHTSEESDNEYVNAGMLLEASIPGWGDLEVNFLYGSKDITMDMPNAGYDPGRFNLVEIETFGLTPKYIYDGDVLGKRNKLITGLDVYHETHTLDQYGDIGRLNWTYRADMERDTLGWYVRDEFSLKPDLIVGLGYRTERAEVSAEKTDITTGLSVLTGQKSKKFHENSAGLDVVWLLGERNKLFAKFSTLYRYPFLDEQAEFQGNTGRFLDLEPEKGKSYEIGCNYYPTSGLGLELSLYQVNMEDEIVYVGWFPTGKNENADETRHAGLELSFTYSVPGLFKTYGNYAYQYATFRNGVNNDKEIPLVPNHMLSAGVDVDLADRFVLSPSVQYVDDSYLGSDFDNSEEKLESYLIVDLFLRYKPEYRDNKITAFVGVKNIADEKYSTAGTEFFGMNVYYPAPGRKFLAGISGTF